MNVLSTNNGALLTKRKIDRLFQRLAQLNPDPTTELNYTTPFELLIAVILSAQATDLSVNKVTSQLFKVANTPKAILELGELGLQQYIRTIGLFKTKSKHIIMTCKILQEKFYAKVPKTMEELQSLPGVGRKTANVILNTIWGVPTIAVDTHVFRVANRIGLASSNNPLVVENLLFQTIPIKFRSKAHHWLILHGRYTCKAKNPKCSECIINDICTYYNKI